MDLNENDYLWRLVMAQARNFSIDDSDNIEHLIERHKSLLHLRHDLLHILVCDLIGDVAVLGVTNKIKNLFPLQFPQNIGKLTPDIVYKHHNRVFIIDVTVRSRPEKARAEKIIKYTCIKDFLNENGYASEIIIIACDRDFRNFMQEINQLQQIIPFELADKYVRFTTDVAFIQTNANSLSNRIPQEYMTEAELEPNFRAEFYDEKVYKGIYKDGIHARLDDIKDITLNDAFCIMDEYLEDPQVRNVMADAPHSVSNYHEAFGQLQEMEPAKYTEPKPSFHFLYMPQHNLTELTGIKLPNNLTDAKTDQQTAYRILKFVCTMGLTGNKIALCKHILKDLETILEDENEAKIYNTGFYTGTQEGDTDVKRQYCKEQDIPLHKAQFKSIRKIKSQEYKQQRPYAERSHQISISSAHGEAHEFLIKSGVRFKTHHPEGRTYGDPASCEPKTSEKFGEFLDLISESTSIYKKYDDLWDRPIGLDTKSVMKIKEKFRSEFREFHKVVANTYAHHMSYATSIAADQAMHYTSLNTKEQSLCLINTGLNSVLHIYQGGTINRASDVGCPFFSIGITTDKRWVNPVWGGYTVYKIKSTVDIYVVITNWRRLQIHKLCLLRDQFYSCLSTGFDTFQRNKVSSTSRIKSYKAFIYGFRTLVAQCTSQRVAEFLMDVRYVVMSCYSDYTNVTALIKDKFAPHYPNAFCRWIIDQLKKKVHSISEAYHSGENMIANTPIFAEQKRLLSSIGGRLRFPSLWTEYTVNSIQDLFDELFVYVHTGKEPSSNFAEGIKSLKTILKFQYEYDTLSLDEQLGLHTVESFKYFLLSKKHVGCFFDIIKASSRMVAQGIPKEGLQRKIDKSTCQEVLSEIVSTKSCLPEYKLVERENNLEEKTTSKQRKLKEEQKAVIREHLEGQGIQIINDHEWKIKDFIGIHDESVVTNHGKNRRAKVHDLCLDFTLRFPDRSQCVLDVGNWNLLENNSRVEADICIKAQYGAKREFYVINFGAKAMIRMYENVYKSIAQMLPNEMISVPGDKKMLHMFQNVNEVLRARHEQDDMIYYVNGDCTKWSACETFASFWAMAEGFKNIVGANITAYCKAALNAWANKNILIPQDVLAGTSFITSVSRYMEDGDKIRSTQNFLQGMFNYSSSVKAVIATEFAIAYWKNRFGSSRPIIVQHLEHSDDYCLVVRVQCVRDFEDFRIVHKISQKMHGINDSEKKTNCQRFIMEFISLMSFNGQMAYPNIKKTKEVGINVAGIGYQHDAMNIISRSSEAVRLGVPQVSAYIVEMLQGINLYRKYSLGIKGRNKSIVSEDPYNYPIELFGLPDCLPALFVNTVGDPNNYRLYKYSEKCRPLFQGLYVHTNRTSFDNIDPTLTLMLPSFFTSMYSYRKEGNKLRSIRKKIGWTKEIINEYVETNPEYITMKPREKSRFLDWLKYMYFNRSFSTAYTISSRKMIMLRLSYFASGRCIRDPFDETGELLYTIKEFIEFYIGKLVFFSESYKSSDEKDLIRLLFNTDPTLQAFFELLDGSAILPLSTEPCKPIITRFPQPYKFMQLENNLDVVLQYCLSQENFIADRRFNSGVISLDRDVDRVKKLFGVDILKPSHMMQLNKILKSQRNKDTVGLCFSTSAGHTPADTLEAYIENGLFYNTQYKFLTERVFTVIDPITGKIMYSKEFLYTSSLHSMMLENLTMTLYFLAAKMDYDVQLIRDLLRQTKLRETGKTIVEELDMCNFDLSNISDTFHKRMYVFFMDFLIGNSGPLYAFLQNQYSVRHGFLTAVELSIYSKRGIMADDGVSFTFRGNTYTAFKNKKKNLIFLISTGGTYAQVLLSYFIAQRLFGDITQNLFETRMKERPDNEVPNLDEDYVSTFLKEPNTIINKFVKTYKKIHDIVRLDSTILGSKPVLLGVNDIYRKDHELMAMEYNAEVDPINCCVRVGKIVVFNLPLQPCGPNMVVELPDHDLLDGVNLNLFNTNRLLHSYLNDKQITLNINENIVKSLVGLFGSSFFETSWNFPKIPQTQINPDILYEPESKETIKIEHVFDYSKFKVIEKELGEEEEASMFGGMKAAVAPPIPSTIEKVASTLESLVLKESEPLEVLNPNIIYTPKTFPRINFMCGESLFFTALDEDEGSWIIRTKEFCADMDEDDYVECDFGSFFDFVEDAGVKTIKCPKIPFNRSYSHYMLGDELQPGYVVIWNPELGNIMPEATFKPQVVNDHMIAVQSLKGVKMDQDLLDDVEAIMCLPGYLKLEPPIEILNHYPISTNVHSALINPDYLKGTFTVVDERRIAGVQIYEIKEADDGDFDYLSFCNHRMAKNNCFLSILYKNKQQGFDIESIPLLDEKLKQDFISVSSKELDEYDTNNICLSKGLGMHPELYLHKTIGEQYTVAKVRELCEGYNYKNVFVHEMIVPDRVVKLLTKYNCVNYEPDTTILMYQDENGDNILLDKFIPGCFYTEFKEAMFDGITGPLQCKYPSIDDVASSEKDEVHKFMSLNCLKKLGISDEPLELTHETFTYRGKDKEFMFFELNDDGLPIDSYNLNGSSTFFITDSLLETLMADDTKYRQLEEGDHLFSTNGYAVPFLDGCLVICSPFDNHTVFLNDLKLCNENIYALNSDIVRTMAIDEDYHETVPISINKQIDLLRQEQVDYTELLEDEVYQTESDTTPEPFSDDESSSDEAVGKNVALFIKLKTYNSTPYMYGKIKALPSLHLYIFRCWTGFEALGWIQSPLNVFNICRMYHFIKKQGWGKVNELARVTLQYLYEEILNARINNNLMGGQIKVSNSKYIDFNGERFYTVIDKPHFLRERAEQTVREHGGTIEDRGEMFYVKICDNLPLGLDLIEKCYKFNTGRHLVFKNLAQTALDLELMDL